MVDENSDALQAEVLYVRVPRWTQACYELSYDAKTYCTYCVGDILYIRKNVWDVKYQKMIIKIYNNYSIFLVYLLKVFRTAE